MDRYRAPVRPNSNGVPPTFGTLPCGSKTCTAPVTAPTVQEPSGSGVPPAFKPVLVSPGSPVERWLPPGSSLLRGAMRS